MGSDSTTGRCVHHQEVCMRALSRMPLFALALGLVMHAPVHAAGFPFTLTVTPNPMPYDTTDAMVAVTTMPGAVCTASVLYSQQHHRLVSFRPVAITSTGTARWTWHEMTKARGGVAIASCTFHGTTETLQIAFTVTHH
jgi:hypothetical protein